MKLNHVNLPVVDVSQARAFFEKYFGFRCVQERGHNTLAVMVDEGGLVLTLSNFDQTTEVKYPEVFHVGFIRETREQVNEIHQRLKDDGFDVEPPRHFHGNWTFFFRPFGNFLLEILSD